MPCKCHGDSRINAETIFAQEQCRFCSLKHLSTAYALFNEYKYEDLNLAAIDGQLRLAIMHIQYVERELCEKIREIAVNVEERKFDLVTNEKFEEALTMLQESIYKAFPDIKEDFEKFKAANSK